MAHDFLVVGPTHELRSVSQPPAAGMLGAFQVTRSGLPVTRATVQVMHLDVVIRVEPTDALPEAAAAEVHRLLTRVSVWLTQNTRPVWMPAPTDRDDLARAMRRDGFSPAGPQWWKRPPVPFVVAAKDLPDTSHGVYVDPYSVPWNLVPREWDVLSRVVEHFGARPHARVLDLGCGYGKNATALEDRGFHVHGLDLSSAAIARCRQLVRRPHRYLVANAACLPWANASFDCVLDIGCLHCMVPHDRPAAVGEMARVLAPGGVVFSRAFKPRPDSWLRQQPFKTSSFGLTLADHLALLGRCFDASEWQPDDDVNYVVGYRRQ